MKSMNPILTKKEYEIMKILWESECPLLTSEIVSLANIAENSAVSLINSLLKKQYIKVAGNKKVAKTTGRLFAANISLSEYTAMQLNNIYNENKKGFDIGSIISNFIKSNKKTSENKLIQNLKDLIDEYENGEN